MAILLLAGALTALAPAAFPQLPAQSPGAAPKSRAEAVAALSSPDAATRASGVAWLGNHGGMRDAPRLHERLRDEAELVRNYAEQGLWLLWSRSGDPELDRLLARGVEQMQSGRRAEAIATFSTVISRRPEFAEGWNKRATAYYLAGEYDKSIADCAEVLKRNPGHFGALSGLGQIYFQLEQYDKSLEWFRRALEVNPNMEGVELNIRGLEQLLEEKRRRST